MAADPQASAPRADVLLAAAFAPELAALEPWLGSAMQGRIGDVYVVARTIGVGAVAAAAGAALSVGRTRPRAVILLGTCGAYAGSNLALDDVVVSRTVRLADPTVLGSMEFPPPMRTQVESDGPLREALARRGAHPADVATTLGVTVDDGLAAALAGRYAARVEHLEAFAVAIACEIADVPFAALLGVANAVGSRGRAEWREHHHEAAARAIEHAVGWVHDGAPGLSAERR